MPLIALHNVSISYDHHLAVQQVSFRLEEGDYLCIVGENGSGKSSLLKGILGLIPLSAGRVELEGLSRKEIGYLPQQTMVQRDFPASVFEVVLSGCLNRHGWNPFYTKQDRMRADNHMQRLDISHLKRRSYRELSGGQQQRVLLARALCATEKLILLDEPVTGLDPIAAGEMYQMVQKLNRSGVTIVMVSHDIQSAVQYANKILLMDRQAAFFGTTQDFLHSSAAGRMIGGGMQ